MKCEFCQAEIPEGAGVTFDGHSFCNSLHRMSWQDGNEKARSAAQSQSRQSGAKRWAPVLTAVIAVIGAVVGSRLASGLFNSGTGIDKQMMQAASEINKTCPIMVDKDTRLDATVGGINKSFAYNYTLVNLAAGQINVDKLRDYLRPRIVNNARTSNDMKVFRENGVTLIYRYHDKEGKELLEITVTPEDYR